MRALDERLGACLVLCEHFGGAGGVESTRERERDMCGILADDHSLCAEGERKDDCGDEMVWRKHGDGDADDEEGGDEGPVVEVGLDEDVDPTTFDEPGFL